MAFTLQIGDEAPDFQLPGVDGKTYRMADFARAKVLVVFFTCNHCPFVVGSERRIAALHDRFHPKGVDWAGINSNETQKHPTDSFEHMKKRAKEAGLRYPYLRDDSQDVARAYGALRTPHFFVFDAERRLRYTGRLDDNPRAEGKQTTHELCDALEALLTGQTPPTPVTNPIGCNVKWKDRPEHWMPPEACDLV
ncbi:MAG TPA: thioredoxin family protein [Phycisphaerales bacterium]|nr:thioredoxin family protein [Phycisphaerales bacterium]